MRALPFIAAGALLALQPRAGLADPAACQAIADDAQRLACYDRTFPRLQQAAGGAAAGWQLSAAPSALAGHSDRTAVIASRNEVQCRWRPPRPVRLVVQCRENVTSVAFETGCYMTSSQYRDYGNVTYALDDAAPRVAAMAAGPDNRSLGFWSGDAAIPFLKELAGKSTLTAQMTPFSEVPVSAAFDIGGLGDAIADLRAECGW